MKPATILSNEQIAKDTYKMILASSDSHLPGQFVEVRVKDGIAPFLNRPISVSDQDKNHLTLVYKVFGGGTRILSKQAAGTDLSLLTGLGNGFTIKENQHVVLIGGGVGVPPLLYLAKALKNTHCTMDIILGFSTKEDAFYIDELSTYGTVHVTTLDGSLGIKGNVLDVLKTLNYDYYYAVGPLGMLKALQKYDCHGELSLEERMGCGFGACMGCSILTSIGPKRVCKEGPVFPAEVLRWED